ncbi:MAG TPA: translocation/assembly module TamB domain-containing protein [Oleiagrimonas sp.]|nr:translocation/assembly module TamB domain-containing protein [Oleiagrimonas sp.]
MSAHPATRRWLKRIGIALVVVLVLLAAGLWWLLGTTSGLRFAVARVTAASDGAIAVQSAQGDLAGPLQLDGIDYRNKESGMRAHVDQVKADIAIWSLLAGRVHFTSLTASGVKVAMRTPAQPPPESSTPLSLKPPLNLVLDNAHVENIHVSQDGEPVFVANTLDLAGSWTSRGLTIRQLRLRAPNGQADLAGQLALAKGYPGKGHGSFRWTLDDTTWAGQLDAHGNGQVAQLELKLTSPMAATLRLNLQQGGSWPWTASLTAPRFKAEPLLGDSSIKTLALSLNGHGDRHGGTFNGNIGLNEVGLHLTPLKIRYETDQQQVLIEQLVMTSPQIKGRLEGHGTLDLAAKPVKADLALDWRDVLVPESVAGQKLASAGDITLKGSAESYRVKGRVMLGPPGQPAHLALDLAGTPKLVTLEHLTVKQPKGSLDTHGTVTLKPSMAWDLTLKGEHFNPGLILAGWNGALDIDLATQGTLTPDGPDASFTLDKLDGKLRQRSLSGHGKLHLTPARVVNGKLSLTSGHSRIALDATGERSNHIDLHLAIVSLNDWLPDASGALHGNVAIRGLWPKLAVNGHVYGQKLAVGDYRVGKVDLKADLPDLSHPGGTLNLTANDLMLGSFAFATVTLQGRGDAAHHSLHLDANGKPLSLTLALTGSMHGKAWNGMLSTLDLDLHGLPPWRLQKPAQLAWNQGKASLSQTCLTAGAPVLCLSAQKDRDGALDASYRLHEIPLALVATAVGNDLPLRSEGVIDGEGRIHRNAKGLLSGQASLSSPKGRINYVDRPDLPLLAYDNLSIKAQLQPQHQHVTLAARFSHGGHLNGNIDIIGKQKALSGQVDMRLDSLAPIELFTSAVANVNGHLDGHFRFGGTLDQPDLNGQAALKDFSAELPALGLKLHDGQVSVATTDTRQLRMDGHIGSGDGTLKLTGTLGLGSGAATQLDIQGDKVLAADIPAARVIVSPDLAIVKNTEGMDITGKVTIDKADIKLEKLPGAGAVQASPDVVVVDDEKKEKQQAAMPVSADITVDLGQHTHIVGYGLDGQVSGQLLVHQVPGKATTGRGQIVVNGTYKAYGQDLTIKQGRLLFASTPIANPGLDIRAIRELHPNATISDNEVVGLQISGTAKRPVMTVFSNPPMEQSDALSYLITGKPLSQVKGGEGNMVNAAAQALGSATGDLLAKGIGAKLGIDASVGNSTALGTAAFTVGKYLSPRLYLSYGVGLFDPGQVITLRYILSRRWYFEAEQATDFSRASFNYRIER